MKPDWWKVARFGAPALGIGALLAGALVACEYPAASKVAPNPVAYVRPAPRGASSGDSRGGALVPYVAVTVPPAQQPDPPLTEPPIGQAAADAMMSGSILPKVPPLIKPAPVVPVPVYTAPVYGPPGARSGY